MQRKKHDIILYLGKDYVPLQSNCIKSGIMPTNRPKQIVGNGGKEMRVRMFYPLKINDYGN